MKLVLSLRQKLLLLTLLPLCGALIFAGLEITDITSHLLELRRATHESQAMLKDGRGSTEQIKGFALIDRSQESDDIQIQARIEALGWLDLTVESMSDQQRDLQALVTKGSVKPSDLRRIGVYAAKKTFFEQQILLCAVPTVKAMANRLLADQSYLESAKQYKQWFDSVKLDGSSTYTKEQLNNLLQSMEIRNRKLTDFRTELLMELQGFATRANSEVLWQLMEAVAVLGLVLLITIAVTLALHRSIHKTISHSIESLTKGSEQITLAANESADSSKNLADGAAQGATELEETSSSLNRLAEMNRNNATSAEETITQMSRATSLATDSAQTMRSLVEAMNRISRTSDETQKIVKAINEISFQTNILALNASIEAARAGEAGTGFKVVAEEIRALSKRAAKATSDTESLIELSRVTITRGVRMSTQMDQVFRDIEINVAKSSELMKEIHEASKEVLRGIEQIKEASDTNDSIMHKNETIAAETSETAKAIAEQAAVLDATIARLRKLVFGVAEHLSANG